MPVTNLDNDPEMERQRLRILLNAILSGERPTRPPTEPLTVHERLFGASPGKRQADTNINRPGGE